MFSRGAPTLSVMGVTPDLLGSGIPCAPSPPSAIMLFEQAVLESEIGGALLPGAGFTAQILHVAAARNAALRSAPGFAYRRRS